MSAVYEFSNLCGGYGGEDIIRNVGGTIRRGRVTALIGPNGCGKSTLLKILSGALPHSGDLILSRRRLKNYSPRELGRLVGVVAQDMHFAQGFTVGDVIGFGRLPHMRPFSPPSGRDERAVFEVAKSVGIERLLPRDIRSVSGGERQRAAAAMAIAQEPEVFLLDEPTSSLDPMHSIKIFKLLRGLTAAGKTVVAAAHDINAVLANSDDYIAIKEGRIISSDSTERLNSEVLEELYDTKFFAYLSDWGNVAWHAYVGH